MEYSRDIDLTLLVNEENLARVKVALSELQAERIAVPPFRTEYLLRGHSVHFRLHRSDVAGLRLDLMAVMRGVDPFPELWSRRSTAIEADGEEWEMLALPDLVKAKKTQRDKDWPMIRALLETDYCRHRGGASESKVEFWLREMRTPALLIKLVDQYPELAARVRASRPLLGFAIDDDEPGLVRALVEEELAERERDRQYWVPLKRELQELRWKQRRGEGASDE